MSQTDEPRPPLPPFDLEGAVQKARMAEDAWNSADYETNSPAMKLRKPCRFDNDRSLMGSVPDTAVTKGVHHIGLTVPSLDETRRFFVDALAFDLVGELPDYPAVFLSDGMVLITLWQVSDPTRAVQFDRKEVIGLHHLALAVEDDNALDSLYKRLQAISNVRIEFPPEPLLGGPTRHMMCAIPGGIRVEFVVAKA